MRDRFGEVIEATVPDEIETSVVGQIAVVENETDETVSSHGRLPA
jgi:hypothetical protein